MSYVTSDDARQRRPAEISRRPVTIPWTSGSTDRPVKPEIESLNVVIASTRTPQLSPLLHVRQRLTDVTARTVASPAASSGRDWITATRYCTMLRR